MRVFFCAMCFLFCGVDSSQARDKDIEKGLDLFERKIRPVLVTHCSKCHSRGSAGGAKARSPKGGLLLDSRADARRGGDSGPAVVPGDVEASLIVDALRYETFKMPPSGQLPASVVADFVRWIELGAPDPRDGAEESAVEAVDLTNARDFWAFAAPRFVPEPAVQNVNWPRDPIDRFVLTKLEAAGLQPAAATSRETLIRRATYDLTGLPPTRAEAEEFVDDPSPQAFERVLDRLLESPHFGVRWGRHWLDNVRYAQDDHTCCATNHDKFNANEYRDWVVRAFNEDLPYDEFVRLQVAGDLLPPSPPDTIHADGLTATGIWGLGHLPNENEAEKSLADFVDDQIDVLGRTFLGLTLSCARCHDHKFDPISQSEYYALAGIFHSSHIVRFGPRQRVKIRIRRPVVRNASEQAAYDAMKANLDELESKVKALEKKHPKATELKNKLRRLAAAKKRSPKNYREREEIKRIVEHLLGEEKALLAESKKDGWDLEPKELDRFDSIARARDALRSTLGDMYPLRMVMQEGPPVGTRFEAIGDMHIYVRGNHRNFGRLAPRRFPVALTWRDEAPLSERTQGSGRLELAEWITDSRHPLTARVIVNRLWQHLFGVGIVETPSNFGRMGRRPSHPKLLDHLALRLIRSGWSIKKTLRMIMRSQTYQQSTLPLGRALEEDPENRLLGRMNRRRLNAEALRDSLLVLVERARVDATGASILPNDRSLYLPVSRTKVDPFLALFDGADARELIAKRAESTSAPQSLFLLNNPFILHVANEVGASVVRREIEDGDRLHLAYEMVYSRTPRDDEYKLGLLLLKQAREAREGDDIKAWADFCHVLLCSNEFLHID